MKNTQEHSIEDLYTKDPEISLNLLIESKSNKDLWIT